MSKFFPSKADPFLERLWQPEKKKNIKTIVQFERIAEKPIQLKITENLLHICFSGNYLIDFQAVSAGTYVFTSVIQYLSVSVSQCAQLCIEQQGTSCHGFYFCEKNTACHLTSAQAGQPQVHVDTSSQAILCNYYKSKLNI